MTTLARPPGILWFSINSDVTGALGVAVRTSIPVHARAFGALLHSLGLIQEPGGASA